jgi:hypothetical protein
MSDPNFSHPDDPDLAALRGEPRFEALLKRLERSA